MASRFRPEIRNRGCLTRWLLAFATGLIIMLIPSFFVLGCLAPIQYCVSFISAPDMTVGRMLRNSGLILVGFIMYPLISGAALAVGLVSTVAMYVVTLLLLTPVVWLSFDLSFGAAPKLGIAFATFTIFQHVGMPASAIVQMLWKNLVNGIVSSFTVFFVVILFRPNRATLQVQKIMSNFLSDTASAVSTQVSSLLRRRDNSASAPTTQETLDSNLHYRDEVTTDEWEKYPPKIKPFANYASVDIFRLNKAYDLIQVGLWEPTVGSSNQNKFLHQCPRLLERCDQLVVAFGGFLSALEYEDVRSCGDFGARLFFTNDETTELWKELGASTVAVLQYLGTWLCHRNCWQDNRLDMNLLVRIRRLNEELTNLIPVRITKHLTAPENGRKMEPGLIRSMTFVAFNFINLSEITVAAAEVVHEMLCKDEKVSIRTWLFSPFEWIFMVLRFEAAVLPANVPKIGTPAELMALVQSFRFIYVIRFMVMIAAIMFFDFFIFEDRRGNVSGWLILSACLVHQPSTESTLMTSLLRSLGTVIGSCAGGLAMLSPVFATSPTLIGFFLTSTSSIMLLVFESFPFLRKLAYAKLLTVLTNVLMVSCQYSPGCTDNCAGTFQFAVNRLISVVLGVVISFLFQLLFFPRFAQDDAREGLAGVLKRESDCFKLLIQHYRGTVEAMSRLSRDGDDTEKSTRNDQVDLISNESDELFRSVENGSEQQEVDENETSAPTSHIGLYLSRIKDGLLHGSQDEFTKVNGQKRPSHMRSSSQATEGQSGDQNSGLLPSRVTTESLLKNAKFGHGILRSSTMEKRGNGSMGDSILVVSTGVDVRAMNELEAIQVNLTKINGLLGQTPVVTEHAWLRYITLGVSRVMSDMLTLEESIFVNLASLTALMRRAEQVRTQKLVSGMVETLLGTMEHALMALSHMVKVFHFTLSEKYVSTLALEVVAEAQQMLSEQRLVVREEFQRSSRELRKNMEQNLKRYSGSGEENIELDIDFVLLNCIFFMVSVIFDNFELIVTEFRVHGEKEIERYKFWRGLPRDRNN